MKDNISRRDFLKTTSASAAGASMLSLGQLSSAFGFKKDRASRVVIASDEECYDGSNVDQPKVQDMVDHAIMTLTGISDKAAAYESLFPAGELTTSTKIFVNINPQGNSTTKDAVLEALTNGLASMLNGMFPAGNVIEKGNSNSDTASSESFTVGSREYFIRQPWVDECDFIIQLPSCIGNSFTGISGFYKSLLNAITSTQGVGGLHSYFTDSDEPAVSIMCSQPTFKDKTVLSLKDAIVASPSARRPITRSEFANTYSVLASKDLIANDYQGVLILADNGLSSSNESTALEVLSYAAMDPYNLGTDDPDEMEVIRISPPWNTEIVSFGNGKITAYDIQVKSHTTHTIFSYPRKGDSHTLLEIFDMQGRKIQVQRSSENSIVWNNDDLHGNKVTSGMYLYQLKVGDIIARGRVALK